jgi:hypothetical protein
MLYVFRCAIYYASNTDHDPGLPSVALAKAGASKMGKLEGQGITKLAKLDFLLRYPMFLERLLPKIHKTSRK